LRISRLALLALVLVLPLSGWALVSAAVFKVPTFVFGAVWIPHLAMFDQLSDPEPAARLTRGIHLVLSAVFLAVAIAHALFLVGQGGWFHRRR
jgi:cytochrome b561